MKALELVIVQTETRTVTKQLNVKAKRRQSDPADRAALNDVLQEMERRLAEQIARREAYRQRALKAAATRKANAEAQRLLEAARKEFFRNRALKAAATRKANQEARLKLKKPQKKTKKGGRYCTVCGSSTCNIGPFARR